MIEASTAFQHLKLWLIDGTGLSKDALHVYAGLAIFVAVHMLWRWRRRGLAAWLAALAVALGAEWLDMQGETLRGALQPDAAHWHDVWNTMVWPTVLLAVRRWLAPAHADASTEDAAPEPSGEDAAPEPSGEDAERRFEQA